MRKAGQHLIREKTQLENLVQLQERQLQANTIDGQGKVQELQEVQEEQ